MDKTQQTESFKQLLQIALVEFKKALDANDLELAQFFRDEAEELISHHEEILIIEAKLLQ